MSGIEAETYGSVFFRATHSVDNPSAYSDQEIATIADLIAQTMGGQAVDGLGLSADDQREFFVGMRELEFEPIDEGEGEILVPLLVVVAPRLDDAVVSASLTDASMRGTELAFKIFGVGGGGTGSLTVTQTRAIGVGAGESSVLYARLRCRWERRRLLDNEDVNWPYVEILADSGDLVLRPGVAGGTATATQRLDLAGDGGATVILTREHEIPDGVTLDLAIDIGLEDVGLKVVSETATTVTVTAELPEGHEYQLDWFQEPAGIRISVG